jgi:uncharacterized protein
MNAQISRQTVFQRVLAESLPIYQATCEDHAILYAPRTVCILNQRDVPAALRHIARLASGRPGEKQLCAAFQFGAWQAADRIVRAARRAASEATETAREAFTAECLTLYVNNRCNMRCRYCYSRPGNRADGAVTAGGVRAAARLVAGMCAARNRPFTLAFHGGGEPTLDKSRIDRFLAIAREEASRFALHLRTYIATNGAVSIETARWLATRFDLVGVSCDGPPDVQNRHRPGRDGRPLSDVVNRTIDTLRRHGRPFHLRVTISRETVDRQAEIVSYLADRHAPSEIRLEPVYVNRSGEPTLEGSHAIAFVSGFLAAQAAGAARGIPVATSITRPDSVYGPYCNVLRGVLNLVPGDVATACFLESRRGGVARRGVQTGSFDATCGAFQLDEKGIQFLTSRCSTRPTGCDDCLCSCQCTYGCPDRCLLAASVSPSNFEGIRSSFRCQVNRMLLESIILAAVEQAWTQTPPGHRWELRDTQRRLNVMVYRNGQTKRWCRE